MPNSLSTPGSIRLTEMELVSLAARLLPLRPRIVHYGPSQDVVPRRPTQASTSAAPRRSLRTPPGFFFPIQISDLTIPLNPWQIYITTTTFRYWMRAPTPSSRAVVVSRTDRSTPNKVPSHQPPSQNQRSIGAQNQETKDEDIAYGPVRYIEEINQNLPEEAPYQFRDMKDPIMQGVGRPFNLDYLDFGQNIDSSIYEPISALFRSKPEANSSDDCSGSGTTTVVEHTIKKEGDFFEETYSFRVKRDFRREKISSAVEANRHLRLYERYGANSDRLQCPKCTSQNTDGHFKAAFASLPRWEPEVKDNSKISVDMKTVFDTLLPWHSPNLEGLTNRRTGEPDFINNPLSYISENVTGRPVNPTSWSAHEAYVPQEAYASPHSSSSDSTNKSSSSISTLSTTDSFADNDSAVVGDVSSSSSSLWDFQALSFLPEVEGRSSMDFELFGMGFQNKKEHNSPLMKLGSEYNHSNLQMPNRFSPLSSSTPFEVINVSELFGNVEKPKCLDDFGGDLNNTNMQLCVKGGLLIPAPQRPPNNCPSPCHKIIANKDPTIYFCAVCRQTETDYQFPDENQQEVAETLDNQIEKMKLAILKQPIVQFEMTCVKKDKFLFCSFCRTNLENEAFYRSHNLKDSEGRVICPVLRMVECPYCYATGDNAHTKKYCFYNTNRENVPTVRRLANGVLAQASHHK